MELAENNL